MSTTGLPTIQLTLDGAKNQFVVVERLEGGKVRDRERINPMIKGQRLRAAKLASVADAQLLEWIEELKTGAQANEGIKSQSFAVPGAVHVGGDVTVADLGAKGDDVQTYPLDPQKILETVLPAAGKKLIKWDKENEKHLCCLDIDYHDRPAPHESWLKARVTADLAPRPFAWNVTKNGGLHCFYIKSGPFDACELAAAAALCWKRIDGTAGLELKTGVFGPGEKTVFYTPGKVQDTQALLAGWMERTEVEDAARDEYLAGEQMLIGGKYDHTKCPIWPTPGYPSNNEPVRVMESGIYCHRCEGLGYSLTRRPGFAPYSKILGGSGAGDIGSMVKNLCHWGHARHVLTKKYGMIEWVAEKAYRGALKAYHYGKPSEALIPAVFHEDTRELTRVENAWVNLDAGEPWEKGIEGLLAVLPTAMYIDPEKQTPKVKASKVVVLSQPHDLEAQGLPKITRIHGFRMTGRHMANPGIDPTMVEVFPRQIRDPQTAGRFLPQYVPGSKRNVEEAWAALEGLFPKIDRKLVELVICGVGVAQETQAGMTPMLFVAGSSGAAKTSTGRVATSIMGGNSYDFSYSPDPNRWQQSVYQACRESGLCLMNELVKETEKGARGRTITPAEPFNPLLGITPVARTHVPYERQRAYGRLPMFLLTEPQLDLKLRDELQVARRLRYWEVFGAKKWDFGKHGLTGDLLGLRALSVDVATACNAILSDIIDRRFCPIPGEPVQTWDSIAEDLGAQRLCDSDNFEDLTPFMKEFYRLVCAAPELPEGFERKRRPNGWKKITRQGDDSTKDVSKMGSEDGLPGVYGIFADGRGAAWLDSKRLKEKDWQGLLGVDDHVKLDMANDGVNVYVRFRVGREHAPAKVNAQILDPKDWEVRS